MTLSSRLNLHWGRSTPNDLHKSRLHSLLAPKLYSGAQTNCPQATESIMQCVKKDRGLEKAPTDRDSCEIATWLSDASNPSKDAKSGDCGSIQARLRRKPAGWTGGERPNVRAANTTKSGAPIDGTPLILLTLKP